MLEDSYFEPKGADFLLWGLVSPLACGGFSVSRQGFQTTKPRQSTRIHLLQSGSGAEREDSKLAWGQQVAPLAPRRQLRTPPCLPAKRTSAGWWWQSHLSRTGVVWIAEVMNALRKHKRMMRDIHPCTFLCLRPPAHHTPHVHTHTHTLRPPWRLAASLCLCPHHLQAHPTHHTHPPTPPPHPHPPPTKTTTLSRRMFPPVWSRCLGNVWMGLLPHFPPSRCQREGTWLLRANTSTGHICRQ